MSGILTVVRKEMRGLFGSAVAMIFLGVFLVVTLFCFFSYEAFFARNLADVRPLFEWLPILLIFLVSAITMRQWAEEQRMGTMEVLLTLPIRTTDLVIGKFLAGMALVAIALALTIPLPITVDLIGNLDWGPVFGGYVAALLLAAVYMALGLCVSARTDNQVVALMVTLVLGGLLYLVGTDRVTSWFSTGVGEVLRAIGSGSRFESIERGVLDVRDLFYYLSLAAFFLGLNVYFLEARRLDRDAKSGRLKNGAMISALVLLGFNVVAGNAWLHPLARLRADLTETGEYSLSPVTKETLAGLDEPLVISGYFSERTHKYLAPLVPQLRDLLEEYEVYGDGKVEVTFADPHSDADIEQEITEQFGIRSVALPVEDRSGQGIVNAYFHVLVRYGDEYEVLGYDQLIEVNPTDTGLDVRLRNPEYDITKTIRKVSQEFLSLEAILSKIPGEAKATLYLSPATVPEDFSEMPGKLTAVLEELEERSGGKLAYQQVDPSTDQALQEQLYQSYGIQPLAVDFFGREVFWMHVLLEMGDRTELMRPPGDLSEAEIREALEAAIKRAAPGQVTRVGVFSPAPPAPPRNPQMPPQMQPPPPRPDYMAMQDFLSADFQVERVELTEGYVPEDIEVLIVAKPGTMTEEHSFAIDQFLMRGGKVLAFTGAYGIEPGQQGGLSTEPGSKVLHELLADYGITVGDQLVMDPQNAPFPVPVTERIGGIPVQRMEMVPYPFFVDVRQDGMLNDHAALAGLNNVTVPWASPLSVEAPEGVESAVLMRSSEGSWLHAGPSIEPDFRTYPDAGFAPTGETKSETLVVSLEGVIPSAWADRPNPLLQGEVEGEGADLTGRTLKQSLPDAKLVVVGSSEVLSDLFVSVGQQLRGQMHAANAQLVLNLLDWSVEDSALSTIRTAGAYARTLESLTEEEMRTLEVINYGVVLGLMVLVVTIPRRRRSYTKPLVTLREKKA